MTPLPSTNRRRRRSADELELELLKLQDSTRDVVQKSWKEVSRMHEVNEEREAKIRDLEEQLVRQKSQNGTLQTSTHLEGLLPVSDTVRDEDDRLSSKTVLTEWEDDTLCDSSEFESQGPSLEGFPKQSHCESDNESKVENLLEDFSSHSRSSRKRSFLKPLFQMSEKKSPVAEELMSQMVTMQQIHAAELEESNLKLRQREAAIKTLERALAVQTKNVENLRKEVECLENNRNQKEDFYTETAHRSRTDSDLSAADTEAAHIPQRRMPTRTKSLVSRWPREVKYSF